jgi:creatinine amidohydrolase/Fe(II)-dependent formamide hydrolase-like protein
MNHACEMETSVMLALDPAQVAPDLAVDNLVSSDMLSGRSYYVVNDFDEISASGVVGMPSYASPEKGVKFLEAAAEAVSEFLPQVFPE